ncbi:MAG TPA: oligosaccharide flippase family protein [Paucimonas sp.]|nr:oligosaccharide flippase family protein [Paucimonas sp.]
MLLRNSLWNVAGLALPAVVSLASVPFLIHALSAEGYGIVTIVTSVIGYFALFDLNLTAGSIKYLADSHAAGDRTRFAETFWFGVFFYGGLGVLGAVAIHVGAAWLVGRLFELPPATHGSTALALQIGALGFAVTQVGNYLLVVPQALQRYDRSAQSEMFFGILVNVASVAIAYAGGGVAGVVAVRVAVAALNLLYLLHLIRGLGVDLGFRWPRKTVRGALLSFSAYAYLSKLATLMHHHGDKLVIGALAGPVALTFYTVPATLAGRILGLTYRLSSVIYPRASALAAVDRFHELQPVYIGAMRYVTYINLIALGMIVLAGDEFLRRWVGDAFVAQGYPVLILMTVALLVDSITNIPSMVNDALGHPRISGRFAIARGILGVTLVYAGVTASGIVGAAAAHLASSIALGLLFLAFVHGRTVPIGFTEAMRGGWGRSLAVGALIFCILFPFKWLLPNGVLTTVLISAAAVLALAAAGLAFIVGVDERAALLAIARRLKNT